MLAFDKALAVESWCASVITHYLYIDDFIHLTFIFVAYNDGKPSSFLQLFARTCQSTAAPMKSCTVLQDLDGAFYI